MNIPIKKQKKQGRAPLSQTGKPTAAFSYYAGTKKTKESATTRTIMARERSGNFLDKLRLIPTVGAAIVILVSVLFSTTLTSVPNVQLVGAGSPYRDISVYRAESEKILKSSIMNKSKLTINTNKNEKILLGTFSELDVAQVGLPIIGRRPTITMHVRQPVLLLTTFSNAYVIDAAGKVVAEAGQLMSGIKDGLLTIQDQSGLNLRVGSQALTQESMVFISNVQAQFAAKKIQITQATLPPIPNELDFRLKDIAYIVKTDMTEDARMQIGAFNAARDGGVEPSEYMDVRVAEKVFFK